MAVPSSHYTRASNSNRIDIIENEWSNVDRVDLNYDHDSLGRVEKKIFGDIVDAAGGTIGEVWDRFDYNDRNELIQSQSYANVSGVVADSKP